MAGAQEPGDGTAVPSVRDHTLLHPIGRGAYGEVWLARNVVGTLRAVKVVRRADFSEAHPFEREFKGIQKFEPVSRGHDGLVDILQIGRNDAEGYFYYVMELADSIGEVVQGSKFQVQGSLFAEVQTSKSSVQDPSTLNLEPETLNAFVPRTLRSDLRARGRLPVDECVRIGLALTDALAHLHAAGLVHRDIKPSNLIFVGGVPKLADIGLVADMDDARSFVGTEGFIPPEGPGTAQADLFSLGRVLYEMSMGRSRLDFPALPADWDALPVAEQEQLAEFNAVLLKACEVDPARRYRSAEELRRDLERLEQGRSIRRQRSREHVVRQLRIGAVVVALVAVAAWLLVPRFSSATVQPATAATPAKIFILPFRDAGTNGNNHELRGRMTDAFINSLKLVQGVEVAQRRSALADRPLAEARAEAARLFGARYVLAGRLKSGEALTLSLDLLEGRRELPVWSQTFTGTTNRLIELEEQAIRALASTLNTPIAPDTAQHIGQSLTNNLAAWRLVEQGVRNFFLRSRAGFDAADKSYKEALRFDPDYHEAWSRKAELYRNMAGDADPRDVWPEIKIYADRMLQIDRTSWHGQYFRWITQWLFEWDWPGAEKTFRERQARNADWPAVTAIYLRAVGRSNEARLEQAKVAHLNQADGNVRNHVAAAAFVERDYRRVLEEADKYEVYRARPGSGSDWRFHARYQLGEFQQALEAARIGRTLHDSPGRRAMEACALAKLGEREAALKILAELEALPAIGRYFDPYPLAWIHLALGDKPAALAKLKQACLDRSEWVVFADGPGGLRTDPKLDELRNEPEFQELLKLAGLDVWPK